MRKDMYLNCPFCPAQSYPVRTDDFPQLGCHMDKFRCVSNHVFYTKIEPEEKTELKHD